MSATPEISAGISPVRRAYDATYGRLFATFYDRMLAKAEAGPLGEGRAEIVGAASGRTLELGAGTGLNLAHYGDAVTELVLTEPFGPMAARLRDRLAASDTPGREASVIEAPAEALPFEDDSFDSVVATLVLCTVTDQKAALAEIARVLRPGGRLHFFEHVRAETSGRARAQNLLHGPWYAIGHGCHCNRDTAATLERSPLGIERLERGEISELGPLVKPVIRGSAVL